MKWNRFTYNDIHYQLEHLHPFEFVFSQEATEKKPRKEYFVNITFSMHCFTKKIMEGEDCNELLLYEDKKEKREICFDRYKLSKNLPNIIKELDVRKCYHTRHGNYFTIDISDETKIAKYEIYFVVSKSKEKGKLNLFVQSAYLRSESNNQRKKKKPIKFKIILYNTSINKPIKPAQ